MAIRSFLSSALIGALALASAAHAQPPTSLPLEGPVVQGVCLLSREAIMVNAKVGIAANLRLKQLAEQAQAGIDAERKPLDADIQALQAQAASLSPGERDNRQRALAQRAQMVQLHGNQRAREIEATRTKVMARIAKEAQPVIVSAYQGKACGLLLDRDAVLGGNMGNDLTAAVVQGLDGRITTISFELEALPADAGAGKSP